MSQSNHKCIQCQKEFRLSPAVQEDIFGMRCSTCQEAGENFCVIRYCEEKDLGGSMVADHLYGFAAWITTREEEVKVGAHCDSAPIANLLKRYMEENEIGEPSFDYPDTFRTPKDD